VKTISDLFEAAWLWAYTAGMEPQQADDRRAEVRSDQWEFRRFASEHPRFAGEPLRRLLGGAVDDIAWRVSFGRRGISPARGHEAVLLLGLTALVLVALPASAWWAVALTGKPSQPGPQLWYIATESIALACTVVGGAACAAYYPRTGRVLMLAGTLGLAATLWWTPPVAAILVVASVAVVLSLPQRTMPASDEPC